jgi:hypothetical protein
MSAQQPASPPRDPRKDRVWIVLGRIAPVIIAIGAIGVLVGIVSSQAVGVILLDVMVMVVGAILVLVLRWR